MINVLKQLSIAIFLLLSIGLLQIAIAQSSSMLVVPSTVPGSFAPSTPVLRFQFNGTGSLTPLVSIPETLVADSSFAAFNKEGELFIANRHGNQGPASISRFKFDSNGNFIANGTITGNSLEAIHGLAFSPSGELFAANLSNGKISRFVFNASGTAVANGTITTPEPGRMGLAFSPQGELFITDARITIHRYRFDPTTKAAIDNGSFTVANASRLHGITFNAQGDLFVADTDTNLISRFSFNNGNVSLVATTFIPRSPFGVAFSASGELFVSSHAPCCGGISRFTFDNNGNFVEGEFTSTGNLGGLAVFPGPTFAVSCQDLQDQVNTLTQQNQALTAQNAQLQTELSSANQTITSLNTQASQLQNQLTQLQQTNANLQTQLNSANQTIQSQQNEITNLTQQNNQLQNQVSELQSSNTNLQTQLNTANQTIQSQQTQIASLTQENQSLSNALANGVNSIEALLRQEFNDPTFTISGTNALERYQSLINALLQLGKKNKDLYKELGGKK